MEEKPLEINIKICKTCGSSENGFEPTRHRCKKCVANYYSRRYYAQKEKISVRMHQYYESHRDIILKRQNQYFHDNKGVILRRQYNNRRHYNEIITTNQKYVDNITVSF
jgi:hypothetical protein